MHPDALAEFEEAAERYELARAGLGYSFFKAVTDELDELMEFPESSQVVHPRGIRRRVLTGFPYSIIYAVREDHLLIAAIMPNRRQPEYWLGRV